MANGSNGFNALNLRIMTVFKTRKSSSLRALWSDLNLIGPMHAESRQATCRCVEQLMAYGFVQRSLSRASQLEITSMGLESIKPCIACKGTGRDHAAFIKYTRTKCKTCGGVGVVPVGNYSKAYQSIIAY